METKDLEEIDRYATDVEHKDKTKDKDEKPTLHPKGRVDVGTYGGILVGQGG